ncbi:hypothetical protein GXW82_24175 [Streptacidiphilus sp. 4-A2]|nr:hypothetical protein [Streptacidiphilus sp. 4-A2]
MAEQPDDRRADRPGPRDLGPLLGIGAAVGLAVAALCLHATNSAPHLGVGPLIGFWVPITFLAAVGGCMLAIKYRTRQDERPGMSSREERFTRVAVVGAFAIVAGTVIGLIVIGTGRPSASGPLPLPLPSPSRPSR